MSGASQTNNIRQPEENRHTTAHVGDGPGETPTTGRLQDHHVTLGAGGAAYASSFHRTTTAGPATGEAERRAEDELAWLKQEAEECCDRLTSGLQESLRLSPADAAEQVAHGVRKQLATQLKRVVGMRNNHLRRKMISRLRSVLGDIACLEAQIRCYARYAFRQLKLDWSERQLRDRANSAPLHELLADLGHDPDAIHSYYEHHRVTREQTACDALVRLGFGPQHAHGYLRRRREQTPEQYLPLLEELVEIERNPAQHPLRSRVAAQHAEGLPEARSDALAEQLDDLLSLRSAARQTLQNTGWANGMITAQLNHSTRAELEAIAAEAPRRETTPSSSSL